MSDAMQSPSQPGPQPVPRPAQQPMRPPAQQPIPSSEDFGTRAEHALFVVGKIVAYAMYIYVIFVDIMLFFRVFLLLFGADPTAGFSRFVYRTTADALAPFRGLFPPHGVGETGYLDVSALFAMIVYLLLAFAVGQLVEYLSWKVRETRARA